MKLLRIAFLFVLVIAFTAPTLQAQNKKKKKTMYRPDTEVPAKATVDDRIDNMSYWRRLAFEGLVPVAPDAPTAPVKKRSTMIMGGRAVMQNSPDIPVTTTNSTQSENSVFINPNDKNHILQSNNSTQNPVGSLYGANYFYSLDAGINWGGSVEGAGGGNSGDPTTAIDLNGRMYVGFIHSNGGQGISYSDDNGLSWTPVLVANSAGGWGSLLDKNHMWVDNSLSSAHEGNLYNSWTDFGGSNNNNIEISRSTDGGESWSTPVNISAAINAGSHNQGVNIQTGPNGEVYAVWAIYDSWPTDESAIGMARSFDGGVTWDTPRRVISNIRGIRTSETSKNMRVNSFPTMTVDISNGPNSGKIYVSWTNIGVPGVNTGSDMDVYVAISDDDGETFGEPIKVNTDEPGQGKQHYFPWITSDPVNGNLAIIFYDDRNVSSTEVETFCATSIDGGQTWEDFPVSDVAFTPTPIAGLADRYMGDYLGIAARDRMVYPVWPDNRLGYIMSFISPFELGPPPDQPWIIYESVEVNDVNSNNNGQLDYNESATLNITMANIGDTPGYNVDVTIDSENPFITITDDEENFGDIDPEASKTINDAFAVTVAENAPNGESITFTLTAVDANDSTIVSGFSLNIFAPELKAGSMLVDDAAGNNNGRIDAGETVDLIFEVSNPGAYDLDGVMASLISPTSFITLNNDEIEIGTLPVDEIVTVSFSVTADEATPIGTTAEFILHLEGGAYEAERSYIHVIGLILEDWESGDFANFDWEMTGDEGWSLVEDDVYEGMYSAKSDDISDNQTAGIMIDYNVARDDKISFYYKVSSENSYDILKFYIDGSLVGQWSGEVDWSFAEFPVTEGEHNFKWEYSKDVYVTNGDDCAWIDYIVFPPVLSTTAYAGVDIETCELNPVVMDAANATLFDTILWETTGTGTFDDSAALNPTYSPSEEDLDTGMVTLTITAFGPSTTVTDDVVLTINKAPVVAVAENGNVCSNDVYQLEGVEAENYAEVMWNTNGDGIFDDASLLMPVYTPGEMDIQNGQAMLSANFTANEGCENVTADQMLTVNTAPTAMLTGGGTICQGDSLLLTIELTGNAPWIILTDDNKTIEINETPWSAYYTPEETAVYYITSVTDANGCVSEGQGLADITVNPNPVVNLGNDTTICHNHVLTLDAGSDGDTYIWSTGETTQTIAIDSTGVGYSGVKNISVEVTNSFACVTEDMIEVVIENCTGTEDFADVIELSVYPNPTNGEVVVYFNAKERANYSVEVSDSKNAILQVIDLGSIQGQFSKKLDLTNLADGVYFLNIKTAGNNNHLTKIVIQN